MADTLHLLPRHREQIEAMLQEHVPEAEVWAYGSRVNGQSHDASDLDLVLRGPNLEKINAFQLADLSEALAESNIPFLVEARDWARLPEAFHYEIEKRRVTIHGGDDLTSSEVCLGDIAEIVMGQSPPGDTVSSDLGLPLLNGPTEFGPHHPNPVQYTTDPKRHAFHGDILFCVRGSTTGRMNWADQDYAIGRGVAAIRHRIQAELQPYIRAIIELNMPQLLAQATGSTFPNVSKDQLARLPFPNLSPSDQLKIAEIFSALDDKIELNHLMFKHWKKWLLFSIGSGSCTSDSQGMKMSSWSTLNSAQSLRSGSEPVWGMKWSLRGSTSSRSRILKKSLTIIRSQPSIKESCRRSSWVLRSKATSTWSPANAR